MDPEHTRHATDVDDFWDDDDTTADYTPRRTHHSTTPQIGPVRATAPRELDTNWWDDDTQDASWDSADAPPPAPAPIRGVDGRSIGAWSPALEHRPPWFRTPAAAIALTAAVATGITALVLTLRTPAADDQNAPSPAPPTRPSATSVAPTPSTTAPPTAIAPPPPPAPAPPPPAEQTSPPAGGGGRYTPWPRSAPPQTEKPRIDVTRAPISVAPEPRTPPKTAAPGGGGSGGWPW